MRRTPNLMSTSLLVLALGTAASVSAQAPAEDSSRAEAAAIARARGDFSPELEKMKALAGKWEGTTFRASEGTNPAEMTYTITGRGSAVVEVMFPGQPNEMTTVYHDDSNGQLVAEHYCTAQNQPKLRLVESSDGRIKFELAPESDLNADIEGHAHELTITFTEDGTLTHDWLNHYLGEPAAKRNIELRRVN